MTASDKPAILHVVYSLIRGGSEGQCARVALALANRGWRQGVAVFQREGYFVDAVEKNTGPVRELPIRKMASHKTWIEVWRTARWAKASGFQVLHAWDSDAAIFGRAIAGLAGMTLITSRRDLGQIYPDWKLKLMASADRKASRVVVNCDAIRQTLPHFIGLDGKIDVIPNILDLEEFDRLAQKPLNLPVHIPPGPRLVMVARLDPEKDHRSLLEAVRQVVQKRPDVRLLLAGDGRERGGLVDFVGRRELENNVFLLGDVTDVPALLRMADVGLLTPTANEGLSNSILEYMAAGLPVIATACGGNAELVSDEDTGVIVAKGDVGQLSTAIARMLSDSGEAQKMGMQGRRAVEKKYQPSVVVPKFELLYAQSSGRAKCA